jgi:hypothetical protein
MKQKKPSTNDVVICGNASCRRALDRREYSSEYPSKDTPAGHIHNLSDPSNPWFSVMCPCGHYTINKWTAASRVS